MQSGMMGEGQNSRPEDRAGQHMLVTHQEFTKTTGVDLREEI